MTPTQEPNFKDDYTAIWKTFADSISTFTEGLIDYAEKAEKGSLHQVLQELQSVPYYQATGMFGAFKKSEESNDTLVKRSNIGSVTGVFFELVAASLVTGHIKRQLPGATVELNSSGPLKVMLEKGGGRDADILVSYQDRYVIFETKVSPKKKDLERVTTLRNKFTELKNVDFLLIGGYISSTYSSIDSTKEWACYTGGSDENRPLIASYTLDTILKKAVDFLRQE